MVIYRTIETNYRTVPPPRPELISRPLFAVVVVVVVVVSPSATAGRGATRPLTGADINRPSVG